MCFSVDIYEEKNVNDVAPTVGYEPYEFRYNSHDIKLYDLGGGSRVRDIWKHYLAESYAFIYVIDASNRQRVNECRDVFASFVGNEKVAGKPILILANKQDQTNALDESEIVQYLNVEDLVNRYQIPCRIEMCSALHSNMNGSQLDRALKLGFDWLLNAALTHFDEMKTRIEFDVERQRMDETRTRREKQARIKKREPYADAQDANDNDSGIDRNQSPWKASLNVLSNHQFFKLYSYLKHKIKFRMMRICKSKDSKMIKTYDQMLEDMRVISPKPSSSSATESALAVINEDIEKSRLKHKFLKVNKLTPYEEKSDSEIFSRSKASTDWAMGNAGLGIS